MMKIVLPEIIATLLVSVFLAVAANGFELEGWPALAHLVFVVAGVMFGLALAWTQATRRKDEETRTEAQRAARALVDKDTFGGWRRV